MFLPTYNLIGADAIPEAKNCTERGGKFLITISGFSYRKKGKAVCRRITESCTPTDVGKFGDTLTRSYSSTKHTYLSKTFNIFGSLVQRKNRWLLTIRSDIVIPGDRQ